MHGTTWQQKEAQKMARTVAKARQGPCLIASESANESCPTLEWVMSHRNESCHAYTGGMTHIEMSHDPHRNETCHTCHTNRLTLRHMWIDWIRHVTHRNGSYRIYEWGMSHIWMPLWYNHTCEWGMSGICIVVQVVYVLGITTRASICMTCLIRMCDNRIHTNECLCGDRYTYSHTCGWDVSRVSSFFLPFICSFIPLFSFWFASFLPLFLSFVLWE